MKDILRMLALGLALAAAGCGPQKSASAKNEQPVEAPKEISHLLLEFDATAAPPDTLDAILKIEQRRLKGSDFSDATVTAEAPNHLRVDAPGADDAKLDRLAAMLTRSGALTFNIVDDAANPADYKKGVERNGHIALPNDSRGGKLAVVFADPIITGADVADASDGLDSRRSADIEFRLRPAAAQRFTLATKDNVGKSFAIVLDGHILSAPVIQDAITSGMGEITGNFTLEEAKDLAGVLRSGSLPATLTVVEKKAAN